MTPEQRADMNHTNGQMQFHHFTYEFQEFGWNIATFDDVWCLTVTDFVAQQWTESYPTASAAYGRLAELVANVAEGAEFPPYSGGGTPFG